MKERILADGAKAMSNTIPTSLESLERELEADLEAVRTIRRLAAERNWVVSINKNGSATVQAEGRVTLAPIATAATGVSSPPNGERESAIVAICAADPQRAWTAPQLLQELRERGHDLPGGRPAAAVRRACDDLAEKGIIVVIERGSGRRPTLYAINGEHPDVERHYRPTDQQEIIASVLGCDEIPEEPPDGCP